MAIYAFEGRRPDIAPSAYVHPSADVIGDVRIGQRCWIGPGARLRADYGTIIVGDGSSIEDNCVLHARPGEVTTVGQDVTIGHGSVIHTASIDDCAVIGMSAVVSDGAKVGRWSVVGEGAVVTQRQEIPPGRIAVGIPAKLLEKPVDDGYKRTWTNFKETYADLAGRYPSGLQEI